MDKGAGQLGLKRYPKRWAQRSQAALDARIALADLNKQRRARPPMHHHAVAYPLLLAFHGRVYGRAPTHRFLKEYFRATGERLTRATAPKQPGLPAPKWNVPSDTNLTKLVARYRKIPPAAAKEVDALIDACREELARSAKGKRARTD